jgi:hypothetical protein
MLQVIQGDYGCGTAFQPKATVKEVKPRLRPSRTGCLVPPGLTPSVKPPRCTGDGRVCGSLGPSPTRGTLSRLDRLRYLLSRGFGLTVCDNPARSV